MRSETTLKILQTALQRNCGDMLSAAKEAGVSLIFINQWRKDDAQVDAALLEAERVGVQGLVSAAIQRGVHGVEEDVYYKGAVVGHKQVYSDGLLQTLLKAKVPEFAKDAEGAGVNVQVNVANLMPRAASYDQWLEMKAKTLSKPAATLPAPADDVIEAEYVEVKPFAGIEL